MVLGARMREWPRGYVLTEDENAAVLALIYACVERVNNRVDSSLGHSYFCDARRMTNGVLGQCDCGHAGLAKALGY